MSRDTRPQTRANHSRWFWPYHFVLLPVTLGLVGHAFAIFIRDTLQGYPLDSLYRLLVCGSICLLAFLARAMAVRVQDRAIRAEETLRHWILTGNRLPETLTLQQIIALRFASDEEFPALAARAASESLPSGEIKRAIRTWRGDHHRA